MPAQGERAAIEREHGLRLLGVVNFFPLKSAFMVRESTVPRAKLLVIGAIIHEA
jgi:hypothetical protein